MNKQQIIASLLIVLIIGMLMGIAGTQGGQTINGLPIFLLCVGAAFMINWLAFLPAYLLQTEKFYDLTGSITYVCVTGMAIFLSNDVDMRSLLLASLVMIWTVRLGTFLFRRIQKSGKDDRFDTLKPSFLKFLNAWNLQGLWVIFTAAPALIAITTSTRIAMGIWGIFGLIVWGVGFGIEIIADHQKSQFRRNPENKGKFIQTGLWSRSRHPNYFGEIVLWVGVTLIAVPVLQGWQWVALVSPIFVTILLTRISGVPMLEEKADKKWGGQEAYEAYKAKTPVLIPWLGRR